MEGDRQGLPDRIEGERVLLRRWLVSDAEALARAVTESRDHLRPWMRFIAHEPRTLEQRRALIREREREWSQGGDVLLWLIVGDEVAGSCGLHRRRGESVLEIGYWVHASYTRRGIATEAARLLTDAAFSVSGITHVEIHADKANVASLGVPRRLGFRLLAETPDEPTAPGEIGIDCAWAMGREDWAAQRVR